MYATAQNSFYYLQFFYYVCYCTEFLVLQNIVYFFFLLISRDAIAQNTWMYTYIHTYVNIHICIYACIYVYMYTHIYVYLYKQRERGFRIFGWRAAASWLLRRRAPEWILLQGACQKSPIPSQKVIFPSKEACSLTWNEISHSFDECGADWVACQRWWTGQVTHMNVMNASCPMHWQHATTHCNTLRHTATNYNTLQHTAAHWQQTATHCSTLKHTATHCNTLQHTATHCNMLQHTATCCNTLQIFCLACGCLFVGMTLVCMNVYVHTHEP